MGGKFSAGMGALLALLTAQCQNYALGDVGLSSCKCLSMVTLRLFVATGKHCTGNLGVPSAPEHLLE